MDVWSERAALQIDVVLTWNELPEGGKLYSVLRYDKRSSRDGGCGHVRHRVWEHELFVNEQLWERAASHHVRYNGSIQMHLRCIYGKVERAKNSEREKKVKDKKMWKTVRKRTPEMDTYSHLRSCAPFFLLWLSVAPVCLPLSSGSEYQLLVMKAHTSPAYTTQLLNEAWDLPSTSIPPLTV